MLVRLPFRVVGVGFVGFGTLALALSRREKGVVRAGELIGRVVLVAGDAPSGSIWPRSWPLSSSTMVVTALLP